MQRKGSKPASRGARKEGSFSCVQNICFARDSVTMNIGIFKACSRVPMKSK